VSRARKTQTTAILALPGVQLLDVSGPLDVFAEANAQVGTEAYRLRVIGSRSEPIRSFDVSSEWDWNIPPIFHPLAKFRRLDGP